AQEVGSLLMNNDELPFLDKNAAKVFQSQRDMFSGIGWEIGAWGVEGESEDAIISIWTFAGDKINRILALLLERQLDTKSSYDYMKVTVETRQEGKVDKAAIEQQLSKLA